MKTKSFVIGLAIVAAFAGYFLLWQETKVQAVSLPGPRRAPEFRLRDIQDHPVSSEDFCGTPAVIQLWATWCDYCRAKVRDMMALQRDFAGKIKFAAINRGETADAVIPYWYDLQAAFSPPPAATDQTTDILASVPLTETGVSFLLDPKDSVYSLLDGFAMPETILAGPDGVILDHIRGPVSRRELKRRIEQVFNL